MPFERVRTTSRPERTSKAVIRRSTTETDGIERVSMMSSVQRHVSRGRIQRCQKEKIKEINQLGSTKSRKSLEPDSSTFQTLFPVASLYGELNFRLLAFMEPCTTSIQADLKYLDSFWRFLRASKDTAGTIRSKQGREHGLKVSSIKQEKKGKLRGGTGKRDATMTTPRREQRLEKIAFYFGFAPSKSGILKSLIFVSRRSVARAVAALILLFWSAAFQFRGVQQPRASSLSFLFPLFFQIFSGSRLSARGLLRFRCATLLHTLNCSAVTCDNEHGAAQHSTAAHTTKSTELYSGLSACPSRLPSV